MPRKKIEKLKPFKPSGKVQVFISVEESVFKDLDAMGVDIPEACRRRLYEIAGHRYCPTCRQRITPKLKGRVPDNPID